jgi:hypothetical protein
MMLGMGVQGTPSFASQAFGFLWIAAGIGGIVLSLLAGFSVGTGNWKRGARSALGAVLMSFGMFGLSAASIRSREQPLSPETAAELPPSGPGGPSGLVTPSEAAVPVNPVVQSRVLQILPPDAGPEMQIQAYMDIKRSVGIQLTKLDHLETAAYIPGHADAIEAAGAYRGRVQYDRIDQLYEICASIPLQFTTLRDAPDGVPIGRAVLTIRCDEDVITFEIDLWNERDDSLTTAHWTVDGVNDGELRVTGLSINHTQVRMSIPGTPPVWMRIDDFYNVNLYFERGDNPKLHSPEFIEMTGAVEVLREPHLLADIVGRIDLTNGPVGHLVISGEPQGEFMPVRLITDSDTFDAPEETCQVAMMLRHSPQWDWKETAGWVRFRDGETILAIPLDDNCD